MRPQIPESLYEIVTEWEKLENAVAFRRPRLQQAALRPASKALNRKPGNSLIDQKETDVRMSEAMQADADVEQAIAGLDAASLQLGFTDVRSPIIGIASRHLVTRGNIVRGRSSRKPALDRRERIGALSERFFQSAVTRRSVTNLSSSAFSISPRKSSISSP
jgi:multidrug efflux pump subunit AcrA (membrane-fusion protein)